MQCPRCGAGKFVVKAQVVQEWLINQCGLCERVLDDFVTLVDVATGDKDIWECYECGYRDTGNKFHTEE